MSAKLFHCQFLGYGWTNQSVHYIVLCRQKYLIKTFHGQNQKKVYTRLYLNKLESIMRALSDALPTGHRAMANPTLQLHFGCGRATPSVSHSHNRPSGRMQKILFKIGQRRVFFANKDPKTNFDVWMILQKHVLSFKCNDFLRMANLKAISFSATLTRSLSWLLMPWLLASPGHQQPWYWLCRIGRSLSYSRRSFNYLSLISVEEWHKM